MRLCDFNSVDELFSIFEATSEKLRAPCIEGIECPLLDVTLLLHINGSLETSIKI